MADGLCAVDAGSATEWKPVASAADTSCAAHLARRIETGAAAPGTTPGPPLDGTQPRGGAYNPAQISGSQIAIASHTGRPHNSREQKSRMKPQQPPDDALLWRVEIGSQ
jgi:hypothetical protein